VVPAAAEVGGARMQMQICDRSHSNFERWHPKSTEHLPSASLITKVLRLTPA
jgi:hypothetical protein